ncbi:hypothetical protein BKK42_29030 [Bacillus cereus]|nr:hypothetical protein BKK43_27470 [Bacillus cereus]ONG75790.1 hypothetical protein BKK42_29030 [Bacillus cereus]
MTNLKSYEEYKDSGVEWIGSIPKHWGVRKLSSIADTITDFVASGSFESINKNVKYLDEPDYAMLVRTIDLSNKSNRKPVYVSESAYKFLSNSNLFGGELILSNIGSVGNVYMYQPLYKHATLAPNAIMVKMKENNRFYYYWFLNPLVNEALKLIGSNAVQIKFNKTQLRQFLVVQPSVEEQELISDFLDKKCSKIDEVISLKEKQIETLQKYRQSLITETVTRGLNPNTKMKESNVDWIGEIPEHWNVKRLGFLGGLQNGISKSSENFGFGYPFVSYGDVYKNMELPKEVDGLVNSSRSDRNIYSVKKGDVFFTRTSETIEEIGFTSTCLETIEDATFAGFLIRFRPRTNELTPNYSKYFFRSEIHRKYFVKEMNIVTRASLSQGLLKKLPVVLPSLEEQQQIADHLDKKCSYIEDLINKKQQFIKEIETYKKSLIYETVTGKIDVRNYSENGLEVNL